MHGGTVIRVEHVSKKYCRTLKRSMLYGVLDIGRNLLGKSSHPDRLRSQEFWAIDDITFELEPGETLGIIGMNGAGKTSLLQMLNGIFWPDKGRITIEGRVGALIQVGAGFHPLLTGRENIYINAAILGMTKKEVDERFDDIVNFADIGDFLDAPVKHYSSGMYVRLGFAVAVHCSPDVLLIDEILAVGDYTFQQKAFSKIEEYRERGTSIILVSHNLHTIRFLCSRVLVLQKGKQVFLGDSKQAVQFYQKSTEQKQISFREELISKLNKGSDVVKILNVEFFDIAGFKRNTFHSNEAMIILVQYETTVKIDRPIIQFGVVRDDGLPCYVGNTHMKDIHIASLQGQGDFKIKLPRLYVNNGRYIIAVIFFDQTMSAPYGADLMGDFIVTSDYPRTGELCPAFSVDYEWVSPPC